MHLRIVAMVFTLALCLHLRGAASEELNHPPKGFTALFNGENLEGWKGGSTVAPEKVTPEQQAKWDADIPNHWRVENGEIVNDGHEPHLVTKKDYGDFELWIDWKLAPKGDSGIYLRGCPQVQLWDPKNEEAHKHGADKGSGGLWNNQQHERFPTEVADKPTGEWNRMYIRMVGERVTVVLNDKKVVDNVVLENYYDRSRPVFKTGPIHLQTHGSETRFRNVFLREIPPEEANKLLSEMNGGDEDFEPLLAGDNFNGWMGNSHQYELVDGELRAKEGVAGNLLTKDEYDNFIVRMEFKLPAAGNNGLAIRTPKVDCNPSVDGLEIQVLDDAPEHYPDLKPYQVHGSVYGLAPAQRGYLRPVGEWNYQETIVDGKRVQVFVNGYKVNDADLAAARKNPVDGAEHPGAFRKTGHFGFAGHRDPVAFRNIRIKRLPAS
ncbi:MAG TPA: DUF1080 domain-containing protein [Lacipirellula sp.]